MQVFREHIEKVKTFVPPERLLVFDVSQGWGPLCAFLGKPVPDIPFPHLNDRCADASHLFRFSGRCRPLLYNMHWRRSLHAPWLGQSTGAKYQHWTDELFS